MTEISQIVYFFKKKNLHRLLRACHGNLITSRREVIDVCSQRELMRLHKALAESWAGGEETRMLFLSLSNQTAGFTSWLTDQLEDRQARAWRLEADSDIKWERWIAEDWCVILSGTLQRCLTANLALSPRMERIYKFHTTHRRLRQAGCYWCKTGRKMVRAWHTHTMLTQVLVNG